MSVYRILSLIWCVILVLDAVGLASGVLTVWPERQLAIVDISVAVVMVVMAILVYRRHLLGFIGTIILTLLCGLIDGYSLLVKGDTYSWPGVAIAMFGVVLIFSKKYDSRA